MTGLAQQEQEQNSPFTLEAVLEEESDINTNHINDALPFDKCLKAGKTGCWLEERNVRRK